MTFEIVYSPEAVDHLELLRKTDQVLVLDQVDQQFLHEPELAARKRKELRANPIAPW